MESASSPVMVILWQAYYPLHTYGVQVKLEQNECALHMCIKLPFELYCTFGQANTLRSIKFSNSKLIM